MFTPGVSQKPEKTTIQTLDIPVQSATVTTYSVKPSIQFFLPRAAQYLRAED
jgi:hypothetical protein